MLEWYTSFPERGIRFDIRVDVICDTPTVCFFASNRMLLQAYFTCCNDSFFTWLSVTERPKYVSRDNDTKDSSEVISIIMVRHQFVGHVVTEWRSHEV